MFIHMQNQDDPRDVSVERLMQSFEMLLPTTRATHMSETVINFMREVLNVLGQVRPRLCAHVSKSLAHLADLGDHDALHQAARDLLAHSSTVIGSWELDNDVEQERVASDKTGDLYRWASRAVFLGIDTREGGAQPYPTDGETHDRRRGG